MLALGLIASMPLVASAGGFGSRHDFGSRHELGQRYGVGKRSAPHDGDRGHSHGASGAVPELDPNAAGAALTLLGFGALLLGGRRRRETI
jgi:hypothetical protein